MAIRERKGEKFGNKPSIRAMSAESGIIVFMWQRVLVVMEIDGLAEGAHSTKGIHNSSSCSLSNQTVFIHGI
jgi:hypothetical protein